MTGNNPLMCRLPRPTTRPRRTNQAPSATPGAAALSHFRCKGREVGVLVVDIDPFATFEKPDDSVSERREENLPADLEHPLGDEDLGNVRTRPPLCIQKGKRV